MFGNWFRGKKSAPPAEAEAEVQPKTQPKTQPERAPAPEQPIPFYMPPLLTMLISERDNKGAELTEAEVLAVRDKSICMALPSARVQSLAAARGFSDLDPDNVWAEWQAFVAEQHRASASPATP